MSSDGRAGPVPPLVERLLAEQRQQWQRGNRVPVEAYLKRQPELRGNAEAVLHLVFNEVVLREQAGETPGLDEYRARFPHLAAELELQFALDGALRTGLLVEPAGVVGTLTSPGGHPDEPAGPRSVPGYETLAELGRGGMGVVYLARQTSLGRLVALKMILSGAHAGSDELARFRNEAGAVARLQHPNIVQIYEVGEHEGRPYLALEYVAGGSLARALAGTPQPAREAAGLVETLARAVHYAHQCGVVHRDLKPANVLLSFSRETPESAESALAGVSRLNEAVPKITDFGLAKQLSEGSDTLTHSGQVLGTPDYMAPEQARGGSKHVGPACDIYALGVILYESLTGRPPFKGPTLEATLLQVLTADPVPPSRLLLGTPRDLETVALKCLAKEPAERYASAADLAEDLRRFRAGEPTVARPAGRVGRLWRWCRRNPAVAGLSSLLLLTLLGGLAALTALYLRARGQQLLAEARAREVAQERDRAEENFHMALSAVEKYLANVGDSEELRAHGLEHLRRRLLGEAQTFYERFARERADDPALLADLGRAYGKLAYISSELGETAQAVELNGRAIAIFTRLAAERPEDLEGQELLALTLNNRGSGHMERDEWEQAEADMKAARERFEQLGREHSGSPWYPEQVAMACLSLSQLYDRMGRRDEQEKCARAAVEVCTDLAREHPGVAEYQAKAAKSLDNLGLLYGKTGRPREAEDALREAVRIYERLAADPSGVATYRGALAHCQVDLAGSYCQARRYPEALAAGLAARKLLAELVRLHPGVFLYAENAGTNETHLGISYLERGRREEAASAFEESRRIFAQLVAENSAEPKLQMSLAFAYNNLGRTGDEMGQLPRAEAAYAEARKVLETLNRQRPGVPNYQYGLATTLSNLSGVYIKLKRFDAAEAALHEALKTDEELARRPGADPEHLTALAHAHNNLAVLYRTARQFDKAEEAYAEACGRVEQLCHDHPGPFPLADALATIYRGRALLALERDREKDAHPWLTKAISIDEKLLKEDEGNVNVRERLRDDYENHAWTATVVGQLSEAEKDWERALQLGGAGQRDAIRLRRALSRARLGEHARPVAEAEELGREKHLTGGTLYDLAAVYALSSAAARRDTRLAEKERAALAERHARTALDALARARATGLFKKTDVVDELKTDPDFDSLRKRDEFKKLLAELDKGAGRSPR